jgi:hypothetical protein
MSQPQDCELRITEIVTEKWVAGNRLEDFQNQLDV